MYAKYTNDLSKDKTVQILRVYHTYKIIKKLLNLRIEENKIVGNYPRYEIVVEG